MQRTFTQEVATALGERLQHCESASLRLEKLTFLGDNSKGNQLAAVCDIASRHQSVPAVIDADCTFTLKLGARMMVNMAGGILENAGLCLHRHFNCPMIPGSALKGAARHAAWCEWKQLSDAGQTAEAEKAARQIAKVFGCPTGEKNLDQELKRLEIPEQAGSIAFLPAFPVENASLVCDILTPHGGNDYTNPIPSPFIAVDKGTTFHFGIASTLRSNKVQLDAAKEWLRKGLAGGVGAKSTAGYGWFVTDNDIFAGALKAEVSLTTPGFFRGASHANPADTALRVSSLRGLMRYWWRTLYREWLDENTLKALEGALWGSTDGDCHASAITFKIVQEANATAHLFDYRSNPTPQFQNEHDIRPPRGATPGIFYQAYGMNDGGNVRHFIAPKANWTLCIDVRDQRATINVPFLNRTIELKREMIIDQGRIALSLLCQYGGLGSKSRKGFGSLQWDQSLDLDQCKEGALTLLRTFNLTGTPRPRAYTFANAIQQDIEVKWSDPWTVLDRLGLAAQAFASENKHQPTKAALGLPRKIHGPRREPMGHQRNGHQPPQNLTALLREANRGNQARFASPVHYHVMPAENGHVIRVTAFPSGDITSEPTSRTVLTGLVEMLKSELTRMNREEAAPAPQYQRPPQQRQNAYRDNQQGRGQPQPPRPALGGLQSGQEITAVLLDERTKRGGWKVQYNSIKGAVVNTGVVPGDCKPGQKVIVKVQSPNPANAMFNYVKLA